MGGTALKGGSLFIESVDLPSSVDAGQSATAEVTVTNDASFINPWDADQCSGGGALSNYGYETTVVFEGPDGSTQEKTACVVSDDFHAGHETFSFTFAAPDEGGNFDVSAKLKTSDGQTDPQTETLVVGQGDPATPDDGSQDLPFDMPWNDGDGSGDGSGGLEIPGVGMDMTGWKVVVALIALAVIVSSTGNMVESVS